MPLLQDNVSNKNGDSVFSSILSLSETIKILQLLFILQALK